MRAEAKISIQGEIERGSSSAGDIGRPLLHMSLHILQTVEYMNDFPNRFSMLEYLIYHWAGFVECFFQNEMMVDDQHGKGGRLHAALLESLVEIRQHG